MERSFFMADALDIAPQLLGAVLSVDSEQGTVSVRITETEAYMGAGTSGPYDPGSHSKDRKTERNASMFLEPGHAYVYFSYGMHYALNFVCSPPGAASGVLIRSGAIVSGIELAQARRQAKRPTRYGHKLISESHLARGPGNLATALGLTRSAHDGLDLFAPPFRIVEPAGAATEYRSGPRVGVAGVAGTEQFPWRFWLPNEPSVSAFRAGRNTANQD
ncbi:DNA-3-methyladenine glycosylase [Glutamicibacter arilaitensis]|uniref:Putative 3-methyladenine DNA glycosylase n=1 Tax=Glutamicibacter arilaitensis TaxID=256701 RepID=A0A2N7S4N8_9MICC|nr:DNA-3-methyladenine glycosylase [Glutamicibacter arilaitensis]PMQ21105.1 DNA-3-methyladenine glycosylase [Glutamicibacter arilaitensis]